MEKNFSIEAIFFKKYIFEMCLKIIKCHISYIGRNQVPNFRALVFKGFLRAKSRKFRNIKPILRG